MRLYRAGSPDPVPATVTLSPNGRKATLDPIRRLRTGEVYTVKLTGGITDASGNRLVATSWRVTAR
jgi:hypothetical protein